LLQKSTKPACRVWRLEHAGSGQSRDRLKSFGPDMLDEIRALIQVSAAIRSHDEHE
jgi:hypothetical protein